MPTVGTTPVKLQNRSSDRPEYMLQNHGQASVKFDFKNTIEFSNDLGFILSPGDSVILSGRMASSELHAISDQGSNRIIIADPGRQS